MTTVLWVNGEALAVMVLQNGYGFGCAASAGHAQA